MRSLRTRLPVAVLVLAGAAALPRQAATADLHVGLPIVTVTPGGTVDIPIDVLPSPSGFGIRAIEYRLVLDAGLVQSAQVPNDGFLWTWGTPFVNSTPGLVAAAAAGTTDVPGPGVRMSSVRVVVLPSVAPGTDLPLTFSRLLFNEGTPSVTWTPGVLQVRGAPTGVADAPERVPSLDAPSPNPASGPVRLRYAAGASSSFRLEVLDPLGRRVRLLDAGNGPSRREATWDLRDDRGRGVGSGLYLVRLASGTDSRIRRLLVVR